MRRSKSALSSAVTGPGSGSAPTAASNSMDKNAQSSTAAPTGAVQSAASPAAQVIQYSAI